jgi:prophage regulatory protein
MPTIIKLPKVKEITTFSRSTVYRLIQEGKFPKQVKLSKHSAGWLESEVLAYLDECIKNR